MSNNHESAPVKEQVEWFLQSGEVLESPCKPHRWAGLDWVSAPLDTFPSRAGRPRTAPFYPLLNLAGASGPTQTTSLSFFSPPPLILHCHSVPFSVCLLRPIRQPLLNPVSTSKPSRFVSPPTSASSCSLPLPHSPSTSPHFSPLHSTSGKLARLTSRGQNRCQDTDTLI